MIFEDLQTSARADGLNSLEIVSLYYTRILELTIKILK